MQKEKIVLLSRGNMKVGEEESDHASRNRRSFFKAFFLKNSCLIYLHNQGVRPINNLENKWFEINEENKSLSN
jgi:hypothetical protein